MVNKNTFAEVVDFLICTLYSYWSSLYVKYKNCIKFIVILFLTSLFLFTFDWSYTKCFGYYYYKLDIIEESKDVSGYSKDSFSLSMLERINDIQSVIDNSENVVEFLNSFTPRCDNCKVPLCKDDVVKLSSMSDSELIRFIKSNLLDIPDKMYYLTTTKDLDVVYMLDKGIPYLDYKCFLEKSILESLFFTSVKDTLDLKRTLLSNILSSFGNEAAYLILLRKYDSIFSNLDAILEVQFSLDKLNCVDSIILKIFKREFLEDSCNLFVFLSEDC